MSAGGQWAPDGALTLQTAGAVLVEARAAVGGGGRVDLSGVGEADSAAVALLVDLQRRCRASGGHLDITGMPEGLRALAELYGVSELLGVGDAA